MISKTHKYFIARMCKRLGMTPFSILKRGVLFNIFMVCHQNVENTLNLQLVSFKVTKPRSLTGKVLFFSKVSKAKLARSVI